MDSIREIVHTALWDDYDDRMEFPSQTPLLAHYTSISNFDQIMDSGEVWFANPLNMNDSDELTFGMNQGAREFRSNTALMEACCNESIYSKLLTTFDYHLKYFDKYHVLDTYIMCFSMHDFEDNDGALSMWRGYGSNGGGIAFIIDTKKIEPNDDSPIVIGPVNYATDQERLEWIKQKVERIAEIICDTDKSDEALNIIVSNWVERLKVFSLFTKHKGFQDEKEWRFVYLSDRDSTSKYQSMFGYHISPKGVEPKLKLKLDQIPNTSRTLSMESLIDRIIVGPTASSTLAIKSLTRMLEIKGKHTLSEKIYPSSIPYRP